MRTSNGRTQCAESSKCLVHSDDVADNRSKSPIPVEGSIRVSRSEVLNSRFSDSLFSLAAHTCLPLSSLDMRSSCRSGIGGVHWILVLSHCVLVRALKIVPLFINVG